MDSSLKGMLNLFNLFKFPQKLLNLWTGLSSSSSITSIYYKIFFITFSWVVILFSSCAFPKRWEALTSSPFSVRFVKCQNRSLLALSTAAGPILSDNPSISFSALTAQCFSCKHLSVTDCQTLELKSDTCFLPLWKEVFGIWMPCLDRGWACFFTIALCWNPEFSCVPATEREPFLLAIHELSQWSWWKY